MSAPALNEAWSAADRAQLRCWDSASVPVATASTMSSAPAAWLSGRRLSCQQLSAGDSRRPREASRSAARAAGGSTRSVSAVPPASASAGARTSTGSTPPGPLAEVTTAE